MFNDLTRNSTCGNAQFVGKVKQTRIAGLIVYSYFYYYFQAASWKELHG